MIWKKQPIENQIAALNSNLENLVKTESYSGLEPTLMRGTSDKYALITDLPFSTTCIVTAYSSDRQGYSFVPYKDNIQSSNWMLRNVNNDSISGTFSMVVKYI